MALRSLKLSYKALKTILAILVYSFLGKIAYRYHFTSYKAFLKISITSYIKGYAIFLHATKIVYFGVSKMALRSLKLRYTALF